MKLQFSLACLIAPLAVFPNDAFAEGGDAEPRVILAIVARQKSLQNIIVKCEAKKTDTPPEEFRDAKGVRTKPRFLVTEFRFCDGKAWFEKKLSNSQVNIEPWELAHRIQSYPGSRAEMAWRSVSASRDLGRIANTDNLPMDSVVDLAFGLRGFNGSRWLDAKDWSSFTVEEANKKSVRLSHVPADPRYNKQRRDVWRFDPQRGYALSRYQSFWKGKVDKDIICGDFRELDNLQLPHKIVWKQFYNKPESDPVNTKATVLNIQQYELGKLDGTEDEFLIIWPNGSVVLDQRSDRQIVVKGGPHKLTDAIIRTRYSKAKSR